MPTVLNKLTIATLLLVAAMLAAIALVAASVALLAYLTKRLRSFYLGAPGNSVLLQLIFCRPPGFLGSQKMEEKPES